MNKELAKTLTTALVQFIDREIPEGTMCCSNTECESIEQMLEGEHFDIVEAFIRKKLSRLTEFEQEVSDIVEYCKEHGKNVAFDYAKRHAKSLLAIAKKELLPDEQLAWQGIKKIVNIADGLLDDPKVRMAIQNHSEEEYYQKVLDEYNKDVSKVKPQF